MSFDDTVYVAFHGKVYLKGAIDSHKNPLQVQFVLENEEDYRKFKEFKKHRKGKAGSGMYRGYFKIDQDKEVWLGFYDILFRRWSLSSANGAVVVFDLDSKGFWQTFRDYPALDEGYRLDELKPIEIVLAELTNDGQLVNVEMRAKLEQRKLKMKWPKGGVHSIRAARRCNDPDFLMWLNRTNRLTGDRTPAEIAEWMRATLDIDTRAQLDHDEKALERFEEMNREFLRAFNGQGEDQYEPPEALGEGA